MFFYAMVRFLDLLEISESRISWQQFRISENIGISDSLKLFELGNTQSLELSPISSFTRHFGISDSLKIILDFWKHWNLRFSEKIEFGKFQSLDRIVKAFHFLIC